MAITQQMILDALAPICGTVATYEHRGDTTYSVSPDDLVEAAEELRDNPDLAFNLLVDITAIDWYDKRPLRFDVIYNVYSIENAHRILLRVSIPEKKPHCPTLTGVWESANWYERETYDMYGILFDGHPDMRRFYMPEDFVDPESGDPLYPLRKDFPVMGIPGSLPLPGKDEPID